MNDFGVIKVRIDADVNPTEDLEKVMVAVKNIFGEFPLEVKDEADRKRLFGEKEGLEPLLKLQEILRIERIRDAARALLMSSVEDEEINFYINKQAAYCGHVSFSQSSGESPLGPIHVNIRCDRPKVLIEWLTSKT